MTKISTYTLDEKITALDKWIGSDVNNQNRTKNFTPKKLAEYFNDNQIVNIGAPLQYKYYTLDPLEVRPNGTLTFKTEIGPTVAFSSITNFVLSKYTTKENVVSEFLNFLSGCKVLLFKSSDVNSFGLYKISDIAIYDEDPNFYLVTVEYEDGNGSMEEDKDYMISLVSLPEGVIPTKTSDLINDGEDGVNPFISELDINRTEWDEAYDSKINSAEVTGTTTKTLTLNKQDGSTITASWTDDNTDAVTSVFGRTGAVTAQSGDYTTAQVSETTDKKYQTDLQDLYNDATSSIQNQLDSKQGSITLTTTGTSGAATLIGNTLNIPQYSVDLSGYVPYTGATQDVNLGTNQLKADSLAVSLTSIEPINAGEIVWNQADGTFDMGLLNGVTLQNGQEIHFYGKAQGVISNGQAVMFAGSQGDHLLMSVATQSAINANPEYFIGVATQDFANNDFGYVTVLGKVRELNTTIYSGSVLYFDSSGITPGALTTTMPVAPNAKIIVAAVVRVHATQGILMVRPHTMPKVNDIQDIYAPTPTNNYGLFWNSATLRYENKSIIGALGYTPYNATNPSNYITLSSLSSSATGLTYTNTTGVFTLASGYVIPTTTEESNWNNAYANRITSASSPLSISSNSISISQSGVSSDGYLTSMDWGIFNAKQPAGNYITALTGEASASGPGSASVTLSNSAVTGKVLTGVNITGGTIQDTDSILTAFGKVQNQINGLIGGSIYQGTWNASTNTPSLSSGVGTKGYYYIVNVAGSTNLDGITDWNIGDWAIFDGSSWQQVDNTDAVVSVNGFTGAVSLTTSDIPEGPTNFYYTDSRVSSNSDVAANTAARHNAVTIGTANGLSLSTQVLSLGLSSSSTNGALSSTDWNTFNNKQGTITLTTTGSSGSSTFVGGTLNIPTYTLSGLGGQPLLSGTGIVKSTEGTISYLTDNSSNWNDAYTYRLVSASSPLSLAGNSLSISQATTSTNGYLSSTDWTTFNNKQNALTNPITGTGVSNYLPKFSGTTSLTSSTIYDNGSGIGINTIGPNYTTSGRGVIDINGTSQSMLALSVGGVGKSFLFYTGTDLLVSNESNGAIKFNTNGSQKVVIEAGGSVGIGTSSPSPFAKLDVYGQVRSTDNTKQGFYQSRTSDTASEGVYGGNSFVLRNGATSEDLNFDIFNRTSSAWYTPFIIKNTGNVGIGTTSPSVAKLQVAGNNGSAIAYFYNNSGTAGQVNGLAVEAGTNSSDYALSIGSSLGTPYLRVRGDGNVGIGTTTPTEKLEVQNGTVGAKIKVSNSGGGYATLECSSNASSVAQLSFTNQLSLIGGNVGIGTTAPSAKFVVSNSGAEGIEFGYSSGLGGNYFESFNRSTSLSVDMLYYLGNNAGNANHRFYTSGSERMRITSSGNVGIGTTSPSAKLNVSGDIHIGDYGSAASRVLDFRTNNSVFTITTDGTSGALGTTMTYSWANGGHGPLKFNNASGEVMRLSSGGTLQISSGDVLGGSASSDYGNLTLRGGYAVTTGSASKIEVRGYEGGASTQGAVMIYTNGSERIRVLQGGNVAIGTTSASEKLTVSGNVLATGFYNSSDIRLKELTEYNYNIESIKAITYTWKDNRDNKKHIGYSAQDIQKVLPDAVSEDSEGILSVDYIQVLVAKIEMLEEKLRRHGLE